MSEEIGKYIYGIIPRPCSGQVNSQGLSREKTPAQTGGVATCEQVYTISYQDISAVVNDSEVVDYTHMFKDALARELLRHQRVIEGMMSEHTIIPMRLGTFACNEAEIRDILNKGYRLIKDIFAKISDKIEINVACTWSDFKSVLRKVGEEKEIKEFKQKFLANPKGVTVDNQMKIGLMLKKALDERREKRAFEIQNALKCISQDYKCHELMNDEMVINSAFLIEKTKHEDFNRKVEELNTGFHDELNFRCVAPLPPYSFYTLEVKKIGFEEIDWARKTLGLNNVTTKDEIKKAHRKLASSLHPDKNPDIPGIERAFDDAARAYKIVLDYCLVFEQTAQKEIFSFNEDEFKKNTILVRLRQ